MKLQLGFKSLFFIFLLMTILLSACGAKPEDAIIGQWRCVVNHEVYEFHSNGSVVIYTHAGNYAGRYAIIDDETMRMNLSGTTYTYHYMLENDDLSFTGGGIAQACTREGSSEH